MRVLLIFLMVFIFCGWEGVGALLTTVKDIFVAFYPFIAEGVKRSVEDYLTSPYFITSVILFFLSTCFGIWVGRAGGKVIYTIVSIIVAILSLASIGANLF